MQIFIHNKRVVAHGPDLTVSRKRKVTGTSWEVKTDRVRECHLIKAKGPNEIRYGNVLARVWLAWGDCKEALLHSVRIKLRRERCNCKI